MMYVFQDLLPGESRDLCYALKGFIQGKKAGHESERVAAKMAAVISHTRMSLFPEHLRSMPYHVR